MILLSTIREIREAVERAGGDDKTTGLVPTMGALHPGHGKLIERARQECEFLTVSIFVNPTQFAPNEDYRRYPRTLEDDLEFCRRRDVDLVFAPEVEELYPREPRTFVDVQEVTRELCGRFRPGHFRGVATVVLKLLNIVRPDRAYFGEKDAQQLRAIETMAVDLDIPVEIVPVATVREPDGLAVSSRNRYLSPEERQAAAHLYRALCQARNALEQGARDSREVLKAAEETLMAQPLIRREYLEVVDADSMLPVAVAGGPVRLVAAVWINRTRLIDNLYWKEE
jgi:pantoate--beta-alanine ligase